MIYDKNTVYYDNTLMTYVKEKKDIDFKEDPFNEVDALLLCQLVYPRLERFVPKLKKQHTGDNYTENTSKIRTVGWPDLDTPSSRKQLFGGSFYGPMYEKLFHEIKNSHRYGQILLGLLNIVFDSKKMIQFTALTMFLDEHNSFIIFRGTDNSIAGWKENFRYSYMRKWPAHGLAAQYLQKVSKIITGNLYIGGHSKGGNLAVYASAQNAESIQNRIRRIFSFDGMGFRASFYHTEGYQRICNKIFKLVPQESIIGMLYLPEKGYHIVESYEHGLLQHDLMNWKIRKGSFVLTESFSRKHHRLIRRLNLWLRSLSGKERKEFSELLFRSFGDLLEQEAVQTMMEEKSILKIIREKVKNMTKSERKLFRHSLFRFLFPQKTIWQS